MVFRNTLKKIITKYTAFGSSIYSLPREVSIEVTNKCNLDCPLCFNKISENNFKKNEQLNYNGIKKIITDISKSGIKRIRFSGGEPLLREDIYDLMKYAKSKGLKVWLNTNATLINEQKAFSLSRLVDNVLVPLNSFDENTEFTATGKHLFKFKLSGLKLLTKTDIKIIRISTILSKINIQNLEKIYSLVENLKIKYWQLFRPIPTTDNLMPINNEDVKILASKIIKINKDNNTNHKIFNAIPFCAFNPDQMAKIAAGSKFDDGHTRFIIDYYGTVKPMYYFNKEIGNILTGKSMKSYWNSKFMKDLRRLKFAPTICKRCKYFKICLGGSRAICTIRNGSYTGFDYLAQPQKYKESLNLEVDAIF